MPEPTLPTPRITLVTEAYNLAEGQSEASFARCKPCCKLASATRMWK